MTPGMPETLQSTEALHTQPEQLLCGLPELPASPILCARLITKSNNGSMYRSPAGLHQWKQDGYWAGSVHSMNTPDKGIICVLGRRASCWRCGVPPCLLRTAPHFQCTAQSRSLLFSELWSPEPPKEKLWTRGNDPIQNLTTCPTSPLPLVQVPVWHPLSSSPHSVLPVAAFQRPQQGSGAWRGSSAPIPLRVKDKGFPGGHKGSYAGPQYPPLHFFSSQSCQHP